MRISLTTYLFFLLILGTFSCKKKIQFKYEDSPIIVEGEKSLTYHQAYPADSSVLNFRYLQAKMRASTSINGSNQNFNAILRWQKGEKIWISMSLFGIEGIRALIDSSGIQWIDRLNNSYNILPIEKIAYKVKMDLDFQSIERLLIGLPTISDTVHSEINISDQYQKWSTQHPNGYLSIAIFDRINSMLIDYQAENPILHRYLVAKYGDVRNIGNNYFSFERMLKISQNNDFFEMQSKFSEVTILDSLSFPFDIPVKYKRIEY
ncbi:MAG: DUF4292 domain-containing protein [Chitinophagales bacterium]|nr:DUF4292 domain-containing protein [Chitinophagales bacterium]MCZ2392901.1 DUF4292 domain-containing protein [Chitinophagales bacterium]